MFCSFIKPLNPHLGPEAMDLFVAADQFGIDRLKRPGPGVDPGLFFKKRGLNKYQ